MKKHLFLTLIATAMLFVMASCTEDPLSHFTDSVVVTTTFPKYISGNSAICGAEVTADDMGLMIELGVCWSKTEKPTIEDHVEKTYKCSKPFNCLLYDLEPNTTYHVRGYAKYGTEICYGDEKTFTTLNNTTDSGGSFLTTLPAYEINSYGFTSGGDLALPDDIDIDFNFQIVGVCISESPNPTIEEGRYFINNYYYENQFLIGTYDLEPNTQYYYRAFVAYGNGFYNEYYYYDLTQFNIIYGNTLSVTTLEIPLTLNILTYSPEYDWWSNTLYIDGYLYTNKPNVIDEVGFCYSYTNEYPQYESDLFVSAGTPTGEDYFFNSQISDLSANTRYYICSFARYMTDSIKYGDVVSFYTYKKSAND